MPWKTSLGMQKGLLNEITQWRLSCSSLVLYGKLIDNIYGIIRNNRFNITKFTRFCLRLRVHQGPEDQLGHPKFPSAGAILWKYFLFFSVIQWLSPFRPSAVFQFSFYELLMINISLQMEPSPHIFRPYPHILAWYVWPLLSLVELLYYPWWWGGSDPWVEPRHETKFLLKVLSSFHFLEMQENIVISYILQKF